MSNCAVDNVVRSRCENAAHWLVRLQNEELDEIEHDTFKAWLASDRKNAEEFAVITHLSNIMEDIESGDKDDHLAFATNERESRQSRSRHRIGTGLAASLALLGLIAAGGSLLSRGGPEQITYSTGTGENRTVLLDDGSVIHLNTRTELRWLIDDRTRQVDLIEGEALFDVVPEADRPFVVQAGAGMLRALGTRFNVYRKSRTAVVVTVLEGQVEVSDVDEHVSEPNWQRNLTANQEVLYRDAGLASEVKETVATESISWRDGVMVIEDQTLSEVIEELNRYSRRRIVILDPTLNDVRTGGIVSVRDIRATLEFFETGGVFKLVETPDSYLLTTKASAGTGGA